MTLDEVKEELSEWRHMDNRMAVVLKETGEVIGGAGYWVDADGDYSIDYDFNPKFWHKGYATEAAKEVVRHLTEDLRVKEIYGDCDEKNIASAGLLERLGFKLIFKDKDGSYKVDSDGKPIKITVSVHKLSV